MGIVELVFDFICPLIILSLCYNRIQYRKYKSIREAKLQTNVPIGSIFLFCGKKIPEGYLECKGQKLDKLVYTQLFSVIGYSWSTNKIDLQLPDIKPNEFSNPKVLSIIKTGRPNKRYLPINKNNWYI